MSTDVLKTVFAGITTLILVVGLFWFMYEALLDPNVAAIPQENQNFIFGGLFTLVGVALAWTFNASQQSSNAKNQQQAIDSAVTAALSTPPSSPVSSEPAVVPTLVPTEDPQTAMFMCPVDGLTFTTETGLDQHLVAVHPPATNE